MSHQAATRSRILRSLDPPTELLYHYTRGDTLRLILDGAMLRLGPYPETNDPAENQRWFFSMSGAVTAEREDDSAYWRDTENADRLTRRRAALACLTMDRPHDPDNGYGYFHRGWARARMWAQYAEAHLGVCLVFDRARLGRAIAAHKPLRAQLYEGPVEYEDRALSPHLPWGPVDRLGIDAAVTEFMAANWQEVFFHKNTDWASEVEYRYVVLHDGAPLLVPVATALVAVVLGQRFPEGDTAWVRSALGKLGSDIPVVRCSWFNGGPSLGYPKSWPQRNDF
jgi:hypothetical protein